MAIGDLLNQTISVQNPTSTRDKHGNLGVGSATSVACRAERTNKVISTPERERDPVHLLVMIGPTSTVNIGAKITYDGDEYRVLSKSDAPGGDGAIHHYELACQLWSYA